jgi:hypothetical protein
MTGHGLRSPDATIRHLIDRSVELYCSIQKCHDLSFPVRLERFPSVQRRTVGLRVCPAGADFSEFTFDGPESDLKSIGNFLIGRAAGLHDRNGLQTLVCE